MKSSIVVLYFSCFFILSCTNQQANKSEKKETTKPSTSQQKAMMHLMSDDQRLSLGLNAMQKQHQSKIMRQHLETIEKVTRMIANNEFDKAAETIDIELGSSTEMKLMCASFGNETFEKIGLEMHESADKLSEILKTKNKDISLQALSNTINYCTSCHAAFKQ